MRPMSEKEDREVIRFLARVEATNLVASFLLIAVMLAACWLLDQQTRATAELQAQMATRNMQGDKALSLLAERNGQAQRQIELLEQAVQHLGGVR